MTPRSAARRTPDRHTTLLDLLGAAICAGEIPVGTVLSADELCERHGISRSVVREALRVLASMGLVDSKRGVGTTTQPRSAWNLLDTQVIDWRLRSPARLDQLRELAELRVGVEPEASALAAQRSDPDAVGRLMAVGAGMWDAAHRGDTEEFLRLDITFHTLVLEASGNPMYSQFAPVVRALLLGRAEHGLAAMHPREHALECHMTILRAIQTGDPDRARSTSREMIMDALEESRSLWEAASV